MADEVDGQCSEGALRGLAVRLVGSEPFENFTLICTKWSSQLLLKMKMSSKSTTTVFLMKVFGDIVHSRHEGVIKLVQLGQNRAFEVSHRRVDGRLGGAASRMRT